MARIAYLDIIGGISGDMFISAMLDAGLTLPSFRDELKKILPHPFSISPRKTTRGAISATHINIDFAHADPKRLNWHDFEAAIAQSGLPAADKSKIRAVFDCLKEAESEAHHAPVGTSHLHELGSLDTLIDIAGAVIGLRLLGVENLYISSLPASVGMSASSHGKGASIAPATMSIIKKAQLPVRVSGPIQPAGESITPTGAAIVATLASTRPRQMNIETVGYGAGTRDTDTPPNVVGLWLGEATNDHPALTDTTASMGVEHQSDVFLIETNLDDMTGEELGYAMQSLFEHGALDVWTSPIQMKKSRPGVILSAIVQDRNLQRVALAYLTQTSTFGIRVRRLERLVADREVVQVQTEFGEIRVKLRRVDGVVTQVAPEYDDCARVASETGVSLRHVMDVARMAASSQMAGA